MAIFFAQAPVSWDRPFDVADGFAITLILMLFLVLGGVAVVARGFRQRERAPKQESWQDLKEGEAESDHSPDQSSVFPIKKSHSGANPASWERDADWWKRSPEGDERP